MRHIKFESSAFEDFGDWSEIDRKVFKRIRQLIVETARTPLTEQASPNL